MPPPYQAPRGRPSSSKDGRILSSPAVLCWQTCSHGLKDARTPSAKRSRIFIPSRRKSKKLRRLKAAPCLVTKSERPANLIKTNASHHARSAHAGGRFTSRDRAQIRKGAAVLARGGRGGGRTAAASLVGGDPLFQERDPFAMHDKVRRIGGGLVYLA